MFCRDFCDVISSIVIWALLLAQVFLQSVFSGIITALKGYLECRENIIHVS
jgi:hypothetical protein